MTAVALRRRSGQEAERQGTWRCSCGLPYQPHDGLSATLCEMHDFRKQHMTAMRIVLSAAC